MKFSETCRKKWDIPVFKDAINSWLSFPNFPTVNKWSKNIARSTCDGSHPVGIASNSGTDASLQITCRYTGLAKQQMHRSGIRYVLTDVVVDGNIRERAESIVRRPSTHRSRIHRVWLKLANPHCRHGTSVDTRPPVNVRRRHVCRVVDHVAGDPHRADDRRRVPRNLHLRRRQALDAHVAWRQNHICSDHSRSVSAAQLFRNPFRLSSFISHN